MFDHCVMTDQVIHSLKLSKLLMQLRVAQPMLFWSAIRLFASLARIAQDGGAISLWLNAFAGTILQRVSHLLTTCHR